MLYKELCRYYQRLEAETGKIAMMKILSDCFKKADPEEVDKIAYLTLGKLWPDWKGMPELGIGEKLTMRAISRATGVDVKKIEDIYKRKGDLGETAAFLVSQKRMMTLFQKELEVKDVYEAFRKIALASGPGAMDMKVRILTGLLVSASPIEAKYIVRTVLGKLRLGVGEATILAALADAFLGSDKYKDIVEEAYNKHPDIGYIAKLAVKGREALEHVKIEPGVPVRPMLAERLSDPAEILMKAGGKAYAEYKYDGERAQIHKKGDKIWIYSRRLENITYQYPDVVEWAKKYIDAEEAIVEGEIVAIDPDTGDFRPFQELMHRKRKYDIHKVMEEIPVKVFLFDVLYLNGQELLKKPYAERRKILERIIKPNENITLAQGRLVEKVEELEKLFLEAVSDGCEGLVVKNLSEIYVAGTRGWRWIKYKRDYKSEMADTVDLVVIGGFHGRGRRSGTYGALLVAAYNPDKDCFESVCKVGSGFTDADLAELPRILDKYKVPTKPKNVVTEMEPDVWFEPKVVMEVIGAELTLSPVHRAAFDLVRERLKKPAGIAIRFPRFVRWRPDKAPTDATTSKELFEMYLRQLKKLKE